MLNVKQKIVNFKSPEFPCEAAQEGPLMIPLRMQLSPTVVNKGHWHKKTQTIVNFFKWSLESIQ